MNNEDHPEFSVSFNADEYDMLHDLIFDERYRCTIQYSVAFIKKDETAAAKWHKDIEVLSSIYQKLDKSLIKKESDNEPS